MDADALYENIVQLEALRPSFVSVTYRAGGSTRGLTHDLVIRLKETTTLDPIRILPASVTGKRIRERCELAGIRVPIIAGIMPVTSLGGMKRMAQLAPGARFPAKLLRALGRASDDAEAVKRVGVHWAREQCRELLDNQVRGIHFYTLNRSDATWQIYQSLGLRDSIPLRRTAVRKSLC